MIDTLSIPRTATITTPSGQIDPPRAKLRAKLARKVAPEPSKKPSPLFLQFLAHLWRGGAYGYWWTRSEARNSKGRALETRTFWQDASTPGDLPPDRGNHGPRHIYFSVNPTAQKGQPDQRATLQGPRRPVAINALYAECDAKDFGGDKAAVLAHVKSLDPRPSGFIDSGNGYQPYWLLDQPYILDTPEAQARAEHVQRAWVEYAGGDKGASDLARVLRSPGTLNYKANLAPNYPTVEIVEMDLGRQYTFEELAALVETEPEQSTPEPRQEPAAAVDLSDDDAALLERARNNPTTGARFASLYDRGDLSGNDGDHSAGDLALCNSLAYWTNGDRGAIDRLYRESALYRAKWDAPHRADGATYGHMTIDKALAGLQSGYQPRKADAASAPDARALEARLETMAARIAELEAREAQRNEILTHPGLDGNERVLWDGLLRMARRNEEGDLVIEMADANRIAQRLNLAPGTVKRKLQRLQEARLVDRHITRSWTGWDGKELKRPYTKSVTLLINEHEQLPEQLPETEAERKNRERGRDKLRDGAAALAREALRTKCPECGETDCLHLKRLEFVCTNTGALVEIAPGEDKESSGANCSGTPQSTPRRATEAPTGAICAAYVRESLPDQIAPLPEPTTERLPTIPTVGGQAGSHTTVESVDSRLPAHLAECPLEPLEPPPDDYAAAVDWLENSSSVEPFSEVEALGVRLQRATALDEPGFVEVEAPEPTGDSVSLVENRLHAATVFAPAIAGQIRTKLAERDTKAARVLLKQIQNPKERARLSEEIAAQEWAAVQALCAGAGSGAEK